MLLTMLLDSALFTLKKFKYNLLQLNSEIDDPVVLEDTTHIFIIKFETQCINSTET